MKKPEELTLGDLKKEVRVGRLKYDQRLLDEMTPYAIFCAMGMGVVTRVDSEFGTSFHADVLEFVTWSPIFRPVGEGEMIPEYTVVVDKENKVPVFVEKTRERQATTCPDCKQSMAPTWVRGKVGTVRAWLCGCVQDMMEVDG